MRLLIQRVSSASVTVADKTIGQISTGLCVFVGIGPMTPSRLMDGQCAN